MSLVRKIKTGTIGLLMSAFLLLFTFTPKITNAQPGARVSFQVFYDDLAPYGTWFNDPQYGYVWAPKVDRSFRPYYTNGYWVNTNYGNMWASDYPWGWAAFHYGRWAYSDMYGWIWIPGEEWGPAWVTWRQGNGYYGWAPMGPGISINVSFGSGYYAPNPYWTFIPYQNIYSRNFHRYYAPRRTGTIIRNTTIINNTYVHNGNTYVTGPRRSDVERRTGRNVRSYQVGTANRAGRTKVSGNNVSVYRPAVVRRNIKGSETVRPKNVKKVSQPVISRNKNPQVDRNAVKKQQSPATRQPQPERKMTIPKNQPVNRSSEQRVPAKQATPSRQPVQQNKQPVRRSTPSRTSTPVQRKTERNVQPRSTQRKAAPRPRPAKSSTPVRTQSKTINRSSAPARTSSQRSAPRSSRSSQSSSSSRSVRR